MGKLGFGNLPAVAFLVLCGALGGGKDEGAEERMPAQQFNSQLPFRVRVWVEEEEERKVIGGTPAEQPLAIPAGLRNCGNPCQVFPSAGRVRVNQDSHSSPRNMEKELGNNESL